MHLKLLSFPVEEKYPEPLFFWTNCTPKDSAYPMHTHQWGELIYAFKGVVEMQMEEQNQLISPQYGMWLPRGVLHRGVTYEDMMHSSLWVANELCGDMPDKPQTILISPFSRAILCYLRDHHTLIGNEEKARILRVLLDQLKHAPQGVVSLPTTDDQPLKTILHHLENNPGDERSLKEIAQEANMTERTLARRCRQELGIGLTEWRNRLRVIKAIALIEEGYTIEAIALAFGYSNSSSFIAMFKRATGKTPAQYSPKTRYVLRKSLLQPPMDLR